LTRAAAASPPSLVAVFHPGTQHSWQTARALQTLGRLAFYATSIAYDPQRFPYRLERLPLVGRRLHREFARFTVPGIDPDRIETHGLHEWGERILARTGLKALAQRVDAMGNRSFARRVARHAAARGAGAVWGYDNSSLEAFRALEGQGIARILDVTIAPRRALNRVMAEVHEAWPDFFHAGQHAVPEYILERAEEELQRADRIVVGSPFVRDTILSESKGGIDSGVIDILPYCFDEALFADLPRPARRPPGEPVRLLFVGTIGPRKGANLLLEAIARIPASEASLTLVGSLDIPRQTFARYAERVAHVPHVPRSAIPGIMAQHDVLVLPSYFEGSAITLLEALASGLALIQSHNAGLGVTPDTGIMLEHLDVDAVEAAIRSAIGHRGQLLAWREAALIRALDFTFARYGEGLAGVLARLGH
jgi:glycosyltransferase involved in cell wall biosynthesis